MKIFLSHSFDRKDKQTVDWFKSLIQDTIRGSEVITGKPPEYTEPWKKIYGRILECTAIIGVLTKDAKIEEKNEWRTKGWVLTELAYGFGRGMPSLGFVEKGVKELGTVGIKEYIPFDRDNLEGIRQEAITYLNSALHPFGEQTYGFESYHKRTCILKNGHGIPEAIITLSVTSNKFSKVRHSFALGTSAKKNLTLLPWNKLVKSDMANRFTKQTFFIRVLNTFGKNRKIEPRGSPKSSTERKIFHMLFRPNLKDGERVQYAWGWSCPGLFPVSKSDLTPRKRKGSLDYAESCVFARHPMKELIFELLFENGLSLYGLPWLEIIDNSGNSIQKLSFNRQDQLCFTAFTLTISPVQLNFSYRARWRPK